MIQGNKEKSIRCTPSEESLGKFATSVLCRERARSRPEPTSIEVPSLVFPTFHLFHTMTS